MCSTSPRKSFYTKHLLFVIVKESSVNPINWAEKTTWGQRHSYIPFPRVAMLFKLTWAFQHLSRFLRSQVLFGEKKKKGGKLGLVVFYVNYRSLCEGLYIHVCSYLTVTGWWQKHCLYPFCRRENGVSG